MKKYIAKICLALVLLGSGISAHAAEARHRIILEGADYGVTGSSQTCDAFHKVNELCGWERKTCSVSTIANNATCGDPAPNVKKTLAVYYKCKCHCLGNNGYDPYDSAKWNVLCPEGGGGSCSIDCGNPWICTACIP